MIDDTLTAFQASQLQFLRSEVDRAQDERFRRDADNNAENRLFRAQAELKDFINKLRDAGKIFKKSFLPLAIPNIVHYMKYIEFRKEEKWKSLKQKV